MQQIHVEQIDHLRRPVIGIGAAYIDGQLVPPHKHRRGQLISPATGVIVLATPDGTWVVPPERGVWIPPATEHHVRMVGTVSVQNLYFEPDTVLDLPANCQVVGISTFMRSIMAEVIALSPNDEPDRRTDALLEVLTFEMRRLPALPLSLHFPSEGPLTDLCRELFRKPTIRQTIEHCCERVNMSRRAFTRQFRCETGLSFVAWRQQACLLSALPRLAAGEQVTTVALDLGYENPSAFTLMFKRAFGRPPLDYLGLRTLA